jgi:hypothetical protein
MIQFAPWLFGTHQHHYRLHTKGESAAATTTCACICNGIVINASVYSCLNTTAGECSCSVRACKGLTEAWAVFHEEANVIGLETRDFRAAKKVWHSVHLHHHHRHPATTATTIIMRRHTGSSKSTQRFGFSSSQPRFGTPPPPPLPSPPSPPPASTHLCISSPFDTLLTRGNAESRRQPGPEVGQPCTAGVRSEMERWVTADQGVGLVRDVC